MQKRATPKAERRSEPSEQVVTALVHYQVRRIDEEKASMLREGISQETGIKGDPRNQGRSRNRLPRLGRDRLEVFEHARQANSTNRNPRPQITNVWDVAGKQLFLVQW